MNYKNQSDTGKNIFKIIREKGVVLNEQTDRSEGILTTYDFIDFLAERIRQGDADYVFVRGNDKAIEITFIDEDDVDRAVM
ncbi:hypothetical protein EB001_22705 [bacterium]|nr:hypothetical protein [bacterium]